MTSGRAAALALLLLLFSLPPSAHAATAPPSPSPASPPHQPSLTVGSKRFTESYILGEIVRQTLVAGGTPAEHRQGLGNTGILEQALASGAVDIYPEYTGTIVRELLKRDGNPSLAELNALLAPRGLKAAVPLGFNNSYALAMLETTAAKLGIATIGDLARHADLRLGLSHEFQVRADGWPALQQAYALPQRPGAGLDHGLAYDAVAAAQVDVIDIYATDAKVGRYRLRVLRDDRGFFPKYDAVLLMRAAVDERKLALLSGRIDASAMIAMNAQVELDGASFADVARRFVDAERVRAAGPLARAGAGADAGAGASTAASASTRLQATAGAGAGLPDAAGSAAPRGSGAQAPLGRQTFAQRLFAPDLPRLAAQHLLLVFGSLLLAVLAGVPLGVWAWRAPRLAGVLLGAVGVLQTIPSLALLAFLIAALGSIGLVPALLALFVYALLPIVRNTHAGLQAVPAGQRLAAQALGFTQRQALWLVELPLARPLLWAGVKTAAVINVGTATVAAFIGAGGFGERIVAGLAVNDAQAMLAGALPAAVLALLVQWLFDGAERLWSRGNTAGAAAGSADRRQTA